jgi:PPOX class probable F420-dependent enzyme
VDQATIDRHLSQARVAHLATIRPDGRPHLVPICFAIAGNTLYFAIDQKPKRRLDLQRLRNIQASSRVSILVDHYEDDWTKLWWIRLDGHASEVTGARRMRSLELLANRYPQYAATRPPGPVVAVQIDHTVAWDGA